MAESGEDYAPEMQDPGDGDMFGAFEDAVYAAVVRSDNWCERCDGEGASRELAPCTTFDKDCACNGSRVTVDPCLDCGGTGVEVSGPEKP